MDTRLIAITGPLKTSTIKLDSSMFSVGRDEDNQLIINDLSVSRHHCTILATNEGVKVRDQNSHNGTFVNDIPVSERILEHGDKLRVGNSLFLFLLHDAEVEPAGSPPLDDGTLITRTAVQLRLEDVLYTMARDLSTLTQISQAINSIHNSAELQSKLLRLILDVLPAERATILLFEEGAREPTSTVSCESALTVPPKTSVSRTVVEKVMKTRVAVLSNDVVTDDSLNTIKSLTVSRTTALLCVPLVFGDRCLGTIYLDRNQAGAYFSEDHLRLLVAIANNAAVAIENARHVMWLENENKRLHSNLRLEHRMIGESQRMHEVYGIISQVAKADSSVLIRGESGTGKELAALAIHDNSSRAGKQFLAVNCAMLTESLLESELFGHEKGAFTGAITQKKGSLELASGGTLFLDELGEMSPIVQAKLLRVLQEREFVRLGGTRVIKADIRLIAATNRNLEEAIADRSFRSDLYYRLNVISFTMPPLRQRVEDIPLLVQYFVAKYGEKCKRRINGISHEANSYLINYDWPGNVRELENVIERAIVLSQTDIIKPEDLPETILERHSPHVLKVTEYHEAVNVAKRAIILNAIEQANGNYLEAARVLGIHVNNLHRLIRNLELKPLLKN